MSYYPFGQFEENVFHCGDLTIKTLRNKKNTET